jgi:hypothetical protein
MKAARQGTAVEDVKSWAAFAASAQGVNYE